MTEVHRITIVKVCIMNRIVNVAVSDQFLQLQLIGLMSVAKQVIIHDSCNKPLVFSSGCFCQNCVTHFGRLSGYCCYVSLILHTRLIHRN